jgi:CheY-like chemotaxis protein
MRKILFIDDDPEQFQPILSTLEFIIEDLKIDLCSDVSSAIDKLCDNEYKIVIMDIFVPLGTKRQIVGPKTRLYNDLEAAHLGGLEILSFIERMNKPPTLLMHSACLDSALMGVFNQTASGRIPKPCPPELFISKISQALCE